MVVRFGDEYSRRDISIGNSVVDQQLDPDTAAILQARLNTIVHGEALASVVDDSLRRT
jgi:hypothetical protein